MKRAKVKVTGKENAKNEQTDGVQNS